MRSYLPDFLSQNSHLTAS